MSASNNPVSLNHPQKGNFMKTQINTGDKAARNVHLACLLAIAAMVPLQAMAGSGGGEFTQVYDQLTGWSNGILGKVLGVAALLVGLGVGVIKQSVIAAVVGIAMALTAGFGPGVIDGVISSAISVVTPI